MKTCAACSQALPKEKFSKKQWQLKQCRRCKECIAANCEAKSVEASLSCADGEGALRCWSDEHLFKKPPPVDECPICMLPLPLEDEGQQYQSCCGKVICQGCAYAVKMAGNKRNLCPFCRSPASTSDGEAIEWVKKRAKGDDAVATRNIGCYYCHGNYGLRQNYKKAMQLWLRAGELGNARAYCNIGFAYHTGEGVERDEKKGKYYYELAAMGGDVNARYNLGCVEAQTGNVVRAMKHYMISAGAGHDLSLKQIKECFMGGHATKDDFEMALRAHKGAKDEMKSAQRETAAAARRK